MNREVITQSLWRHHIIIGIKSPELNQDMICRCCGMGFHSFRKVTIGRSFAIKFVQKILGKVISDGLVKGVLWCIIDKI